MSICIFGDSITWGAWDFEKGGWANRLILYLGKKEKEIVYNAGVSGDSSADLLVRLESELSARSFDDKIEMLIFAIGSNDANYVISEKHTLVSTEDFVYNLKKIYSIAKKFSKKIIFVGLPPVDARAYPLAWHPALGLTIENIIKYDAALKNFCSAENVPFVDILSSFPKNSSNLLEDGVHPNAKGHQKIFLQVKKFLEDKKLI